MCRVLRVARGRSFRKQINECVMNVEYKNLAWMPKIWTKTDFEEFERSVAEDVEQLRKEGMLLFFLNDPLCVESVGTTRRVVGICLRHGVAVVLMIHKPDREVMLEFMEDEQGRGMVGWMILQELADFNGERVLLLKDLHEAGYKVLVRIGIFNDLPNVFGFFQAVYPFCDLFYFMSSGCEGVYLRMLIDMVLDVGSGGMRVCFSSELLERAGVDREELPGWCVDEDYSLWND